MHSDQKAKRGDSESFGPLQNRLYGLPIMFAKADLRSIFTVLHDTFEHPAELNEYLMIHGIGTSSWGEGKARQVDDLFAEIRQKESTLELHKDRLYRSTRVMTLVVRDPELPDYHLVCKKQRLPDGRLRERNLLVSEKMFIGELAEKAATRAILEELLGGIDKPDMKSILFNPSSLVTWNEIGVSRSYPTLTTQYQLHQMEVVVPGLPAEPFSTIEGEQEHFWAWEPDSPDDKRYKADSSLADDDLQSPLRIPCFGCRSPVIL
jgi:hypothetical protein